MHSATPWIYTLSLHDALPICLVVANEGDLDGGSRGFTIFGRDGTVLFDSGNALDVGAALMGDRKSTRLNSSHLVISYAVFCLKKKKNESLLLTHHLLETTLVR